MRPPLKTLTCVFLGGMASVALGSSEVVNNVESELPPGVVVSAGTQTSFQQVNTSSMTAAPEPGTAVLLLAGVPFLLGMRFRSARA